VQLDTETEWIEFKLNNQPPERIGEYISALANSAAIHKKSEAYLIFGIHDKTHEIRSTKFNPDKTKGKGNEDLITWLDRLLTPKVNFKIETVKHPRGRLVVFFIPPASTGPVKFNGKKWVRIGTSKKNLDLYPDKEALIWQRRTTFEKEIAKESVSNEEVVSLLNHISYFQLTGKSLPLSQNIIIERFIQEGFLIKKKGELHISNLGAILLAHDLKDFGKLKEKRVRIITYDGINRLHSKKDVPLRTGYAGGFKDLINYIQGQIPDKEIIEGDVRRLERAYPKNAIREFVANALVHQDFSLTGSSPLIEIFDDRIEIFNPGTPLIPTLRFIDHPPKSRNETLSDSLRRMKICEKRGSGVDRAILEIELQQLPPPKIESLGDGLKVVIYANKDLKELTKEEKCRACYFHSCIQHEVNRIQLTNQSLCTRLNIEEANKALASRVIKDTLEKGWIKPFDPDNKSFRYAKYIPIWA